MKILAVDDELSALHLLTRNIRAVAPQAEIVEFSDPIAALNWAGENTCDIAFLDIELGCVNGIELGKRLKERNPKTNLIFVTGYLNYAVSAYALHASGYLSKPASQDAIRVELENLRYPMPKPQTGKKLVVHCFGNFEVFYDGKPLTFKRSKTKAFRLPALQDFRPVRQFPGAFLGGSGFPPELSEAGKAPLR